MSMSNEELVRLIQQDVNPVANMEQLYLQNKRFIYAIAKRYQGVAEIDDLSQEGYFGLVEAVRKYESDKETKFLTFASYWIKQAIRRYIDDNCNTVRIPVHMQEKMQKYKDVRNYFLKVYNREPTEWEYASGLNISLQQVGNIEKTIYQNSIKSLDEPVSGADDLLMADTISNNSHFEDDVIDRIAKQQLQRELWNAAASAMDNTMYVVITARFKENKTLESIGKTLGATRDRVRQQGQQH